MSVIKINESTTRLAVDFIQSQRNTQTKWRVVRFLQREVVTRITGIFLSVTALIDASFHSLGMLQSTFYALYRGVIKWQKPDFGDAKKHYKCVRAFISLFPVLSFAGAIGPAAIPYVENRKQMVLNVMLLSGQTELTKDCCVDSLDMIKSLDKYLNSLPAEKKKGMEESIALLKGGIEIMKDHQFLELHRLYSHETSLAPHYASLVEKLTQRKEHTIKDFFLRECLSRLLALGFSLTAAIDLAVKIASKTITYFLFLLLDQVIGCRIHHMSLQECFKHLLHHVYNIVLTAVGVVTSSLVGVIDPKTGAKLSHTGSGVFDPIQLTSKNHSKKVLKNIQKLNTGKSLLVPVTYTVASSGHIVYLLVTKKKDVYEVTIANKGWGSDLSANNIAKAALLKTGFTDEGKIKNNMSYWISEDLPKGKSPVNYTIHFTSFDEVKTYLSDIVDMSHMTKLQIKQKAKELKVSIENLGNSLLYDNPLKKGSVMTGPINEDDGLPIVVGNPALLLTKDQQIGDCPKSSLLGAIYYHSASHGVQLDPIPYKRMMCHLKEHLNQKNGYLLDISLSLQKSKKKPSDIAHEKVKNRWKKFHQQFPTAAA